MDNFFINPARLDGIASRLMNHRAGEEKGAWDGWDAPDGNASIEFEVVDGTAVIPVFGALASVQIPGWYMMADLTYENLVAAVSEAVSDGEVRRILLRMNSPGGTVTGCAEAAALLDKFSAQKPLWAHCQMADSAGYWLASAANRIIVDPTGETGSIGTIMTHVDMSKMLAEWGIDVTHIFSGDKKADGSPYEPLSKEAKARFQAEVDYLRGIFVDTVASYRKMDRQALLDMEADTYLGQLGVDAGLADETGFFNDVLKAMADQNGSTIFVQPANPKEKSMAKKESAKKPTDDDKKAAKGAGDPDGGEEAGKEEGGGDEKDDNAAEPEEKKESDKTASDQPAAQEVDQKKRCAAIVGHSEAKGREALAQHLAFETDLTPEAAGKALAAAPKPAEAKRENALDKAMKTQGNPKVGANSEASDDNATLSDMARRFKKK